MVRSDVSPLWYSYSTLWEGLTCGALGLNLVHREKHSRLGTPLPTRKLALHSKHTVSYNTKVTLGTKEGVVIVLDTT